MMTINVMMNVEVSSVPRKLMREAVLSATKTPTVKMLESNFVTPTEEPAKNVLKMEIAPRPTQFVTLPTSITTNALNAWWMETVLPELS